MFGVLSVGIVLQVLQVLSVGKVLQVLQASDLQVSSSGYIWLFDLLFVFVSSRCEGSVEVTDKISAVNIWLKLCCNGDQG